jgi:integrase
MRVYHRTGSPFFYADLVTPSGRQRVSTGARTKRDAQQAAGRLLAAVGAPSVPSTATPGTALGTAYASYVQRCRADGLSTWQDYDRLSSKTLGKLPGRFGLPADLEVSAITGQHLADLKSARSTEGNAPGTIGLELKLLRAVCRYAVAQLGAKPPAIVKWGVPAGSPKLRYLSRDEAEVLLTHLLPDRPVPAGRAKRLVVPGGRVAAQRQDAYDLTVVLLFTGARWHEVAALTWGQIDGAIRLWSEKTDKERAVPLVDRVKLILERRKAGSSRALVFPGDDGETRAGPCRAITRAMDAAGLNDPAVVRQFGRANIHTLRHTYASWLRQAGLGLDEVQPLLGHATIAQTQVYAKIVQATSLDRAARALGGQ